MQIGIVAPEKLLPELLEFAQKEFPDTAFRPISYHSIQDIPGLLSGRQHHGDAFLFLGETALRFAAQTIQPAVPWLAEPRSSSALLRLFFRAAAAGHGMRMATDWPRMEVYHLAFREIGLSPDQYAVHVLPAAAYNEDLLLREAEEMAALYRAGAVDFCITIFYRVRKLLEAQHIPVYTLLPSFDDIRSAVEKLLFSHELRQSQTGQIAAMALRLSDREEPFSPDRACELASARGAASAPIWQFARKIGAACIEQPPAGYLLFALRTAIETATDHYHRISLLPRVRSLSPLTLSMGFGLGASAEEARYHAEQALSHALSRGGDQAYLIGPGLSYPVPLAQSQRIPLQEPVRPIQEPFLSLSRDSGVSIRVLSLLYRACRDMGRTRFTSAELADFAGVTPRTMNRILLKLMDHHLAADVGRQFTSRTGRPSRLIELRLGP